MKTAPIVLTLFVGVLIGITDTLGFQQWRRARFLRSMPSLAERTGPPHIDELPHVRLTKPDGVLHREVYDWLGHRRPDMETMVKLSKSFSGEPIVFAITFEPGVTSADLGPRSATSPSLACQTSFSATPSTASPSTVGDRP